MDTDYADDIALFARVETMLHSLEQSAGGIGQCRQDGIHVL